jgi:multidrug resistance efflux pump
MLVKCTSKDNDFVKKGDTLFTIDNNDYELKLMKQPQPGSSRK